MNEKTSSYTYNHDGIRISKTVDGALTDYLVDGSTIVAQRTGYDTLWFMYDSDGTRVGFTYHDYAYYYMKNAQGDVTSIIDGDMNVVVEYSYDAWGKLIDTTGSEANFIGKLNPFLYRGYYYDAETGMYYLGSRFYDPVVGRFLNADEQLHLEIGLNGANLFAYCLNSPVNMVDLDGMSPTEILSAFIKNATRSFLAINIPSGYVFHLSARTQITAAANIYLRRKGYDLAADMFNYGAFGMGSMSSLQNLIVNKLKKSTELISSIRSLLNRSKGVVSELLKIQFTKDRDLFYSIQHATVKISAYKSVNHWNVKLSVTDIYDFTEFRTAITFANAANNLGYLMQSSMMMHPYTWTVNFTMIF